MRAAVLIAASLTACAPTTELSDNASRASDTDRSRASGARMGRNPYSPEVTSDRYVLDQQREVAESLRRACLQTGEHCALADGAERYLDEQGARRR